MDDMERAPSHAGPLLLDRRALLAAGAGMTAMAALAVPAFAATAATRLDPANPDDARKIMRKLHYRTDDGLLFWWIKGEYLAEVNADLTPLYGMNFGALQLINQRSDGGFDLTQMELGFRTELDSGKRMKTFRNPLNGESMPMPFNPIGPTKVRYSPDGIPTVPRSMGGSEIDFRPFPEKPFVVRDTVFMNFRAKSRVTTPGATDRIINDISMIYGPASQALDPAVTSADAWLHSSDVDTFPRWMKMGDKAGAVTLRGIGGKARRITDMPQDFLAMVEEYDATIIKDPEAALRRPPLTYKG